MKGVTLIGMPGAGKSAIGKRVAKKINWNFVDLDVLILETQGMHHHEIMTTRGEQTLMDIEQELTLELNLEKTIFSPGGSIVYSKKAMDKLKRDTRVIYLAVPLEQIKKHLGENINRNGIIGLKDKGIEGLFAERVPLYEAFADLTIECAGENLQEKVEKVFLVIKKLMQAQSEG